MTKYSNGVFLSQCDELSSSIIIRNKLLSFRFRALQLLELNPYFLILPNFQLKSLGRHILAAGLDMAELWRLGQVGVWISPVLLLRLSGDQNSHRALRPTTAL